MGADQEAVSPLPVRRSRYRRTGRHSSPHQLSLPSDTPALVIAVPGAASQENDSIASGVATLAAASCPGADVRVGYLAGDRDLLADVVGSLRGPVPVVVVPLIAFPDPAVSEAIGRIIATAPVQCLVGAPLGPHPLLAEAVHVRLAESGLARSARVGRISIVTAAEGVIVGASGGMEAVQAAGVVAVLLASRLTIPVAPASLTDPSSVRDAAGQLRAARVANVALAPCVIGPELAPGTLENIAAGAAVRCAPPLSTHPAVGQLVAIRYGAVLENPELAAGLAR
jgi:hypothetical protein